MPDGPTAQPSCKPRTINILDSYVHGLPTNQLAIDIFQGEWLSLFPPPYAHLKAGHIPLFEDSRLAWAIDRLGGVRNQTVLDLGSLEAGHAYMLEQAGASFISGIEANSRAYLKSLVAKEILGLQRSRFWYGDFIPYLETTDQHFDTVIASGVLYHMTDPIHLLKLIARHTSRLYIWTHYYDAEIIGGKPHLKRYFRGQKSIQLGSTTVVLHRQTYQETLAAKTYCGGHEFHSNWLTREGIVTALNEFGFDELEFGCEMPDHAHGPCFSIVATKSE